MQGNITQRQVDRQEKEIELSLLKCVATVKQIMLWCNQQKNNPVMESENHSHKTAEVKSHKFVTATRITRMLLKDYNREILHSLLKLLRFLRFSQEIQMDFTTTSGKV